MSPSKFKLMSEKYFGSFLQDFGFISDGSISPNFFRKNDSDIYHFVLPQLGGKGTWFDIMIFAHSPLIREDFHERFRKGIDIPSGLNSFLNPNSGVSWHQKMYRCRTEEGFIRNYKREAEPALKQFGLPYLDKIMKLKHLIKTIHPDDRKHYKIPKKLSVFDRLQP